MKISIVYQWIVQQCCVSNTARKLLTLRSMLLGPVRRESISFGVDGEQPLSRYISPALSAFLYLLSLFSLLHAAIDPRWWQWAYIHHRCEQLSSKPSKTHNNMDRRGKNRSSWWASKPDGISQSKLRSPRIHKYTGFFCWNKCLFNSKWNYHLPTPLPQRVGLRFG